MIDYGSSLPGSGTTDFTYDWEGAPVDAVFFTHYHGDHAGRLLEIPENIPLYMGAVARKVMINIQQALSQSKRENCEQHKKELALLLDDNRIHTFHYNEKKYYDHVKDIKGFKVEPYSVDHSAYDAYMFLIEVQDKTKPNGKNVILHTGDFRGHGWRGKAILPVIEKCVHMKKRQVNTLIIEGTMMSRADEKVMTEEEMKREAEQYLKEHKYVFLICSSTNLDSLASFYQAAQKAAKEEARKEGHSYLDRKPARYLYTYNNYCRIQLKTFTETAGKFAGLYKFYYVDELHPEDKEVQAKEWDEPRTQKSLMEQYGFLALIKPEGWCEKFIDPFVEDYKTGIIDEMPVIIYSMWDGYINPEDNARNEKWIKFLNRQEERGIRVKRLHTSGHATTKMLVDVINAVNPTDAILPIHTEYPENFRELPISDELKEKISK
jgi:ribonuclease J